MTWASAETSVPWGWAPWIGWSSWAGSPTRSVSVATPIDARALARLTCPASSTTSRSSRPAISGRAISQAVPPRTSTSPRSSRSIDLFVVADVADTVDRVVRRRRSCGRDGRPAPRRAASRPTATSRCSMTRWLLAVTPTRRPRSTASTITWAAEYVLPEPGGPCTGSAAPSSRGTSRTTASAPCSPVSAGVGRAHWRRRSRGDRRRSSCRAARHGGSGESSP